MRRKILSSEQYLQNAIDAIRNYIKESCHIDPASVRDGNQARWKLQEGSAVYWVELFYDEKDKMIFEVSSPILHLPQKNSEQFYKKLLELNSNELTLSRFEINDNVIFLRHARYIEELDDTEIFSAIEEVSKLADEWDNKLQDEFGCELYNLTDCNNKVA